MHMGSGRLLTILAVMVMSFIGTIFLESKMQQHAALELAIIVVAILLSILALVGIAAESRWAYPFATIWFSLSLANSVFLFINVPAFVTFLLLLAVNIFGLLVAILSIEDTVDAVGDWNPSTEGMVPLETYAAAAEPQVTYKTGTPAKKAAKKRKR
jgi:hypothetical protein